MNIREAIRTRRTIRKYKQERIPPEVLEELVDGARLAPSATNRQPLEYLAVEDPSLLEPVFGTLVCWFASGLTGPKKENLQLI